MVVRNRIEANRSFRTRSYVKSMQQPHSFQVRRNKKRVWFDRIEVHEFAYELGDNPSVSDGAPLTIGWKAESSNTFEIEYYETYRPSEDRRKKNSLKLGVTDRAQLLLSSGYSMADIVKSTLEVLKHKQSRAESIRNKKWDSWNFAVESTTRKIKKVARRSSLLPGGPVFMSRRGSLQEALLEPHPCKDRRRNSTSQSGSIEIKYDIDSMEVHIDTARSA